MILFERGACLKVGVVCFFMLLALASGAQQNPRYELLTTNDGLAQGMIYDIIQDQEGFIWFATKDGLNRYDGYEFKVYTNDPSDPWSISGNTIVDLFEDSQGRIWASADNAGLNIFDKATGRFHRITHNPQDPTTLSGNNVTSITEDTSGYFICVVDKQDLNMFKLEDSLLEGQLAPKVIRISKPIENRDERQSIRGEKSRLKAILHDANHRIWVVGQHAVYRLDVAMAELIAVQRGISLQEGSEDDAGALWGLSADGYLFQSKNNVMTRFSDSYIEGGQTVTYHEGNLWVLTLEKLYGFNVADKNWDKDSINELGEPFFYWTPENLEQKILFVGSPVFIDQSGLIWIGLGGLGVVKINPKTSRFSREVAGRSVRGFFENKEHNIYNQDFSAVWVDSSGKCLDRAMFDIPGPPCFSADILASRDGSIWVKNKDLYTLDSLKSVYMLRKYDPSTKQSTDYELSWHHELLQPMVETADGALWLSGYDGMLSQVNPLTDEVLFYDSKTGNLLEVDVRERGDNPQYSSTAIYEDIDHVLWVGTEKGIVKCIRSAGDKSPLAITTYVNDPNEESSLSYNHVTSFLDDPNFPKRYLWVSTKGGGLNRFDKETGKFLQFTKADGLPDDVVYGVLSDDGGNIWGSTNKGLFCMLVTGEAASRDDVTYTFRNFSVQDGLQENEFNTAAFANVSGGRLAFGGVNGYSVFDPKEVLTEQFAPNTYITNILVNNQVLSAGDSLGVVTSKTEPTSKLELLHTDNVLTLEFASLDFTAADQIRYRYQFSEGNQPSNWVDAGNRRSATFLNLQPGDYLFKVQGSNSHGVWNGTVAALNVKVLPPWWRTWWAYVLYCMLALGAVGGYQQFLVKRRKLHRQLIQEKREAERVKELDALKTQLYTNMTHEFRTPLTVILGLAKQMRDNPKSDIPRNLDMVLANGRSLLDMVNQMLNLSRLESGEMPLKLVQGDIVAFLQNLVDSFRSFMSNKNIQIHFLPGRADVVIDYDADKVKQILSNLLSNAFKFTPSGGNVYVTTRVESSKFILKVKDTGKGIPTGDLENVFDRFYQVDNSITSTNEGSGIGLALTKELVVLMGGEISVQSPPVGAKTGAEFTVALPISNEAPEEVLRVDQNESKSGQEELAIGPKILPEVDEKSIVVQGDKPLVLIAEDNEDVASYVSSCLYSDYRLAIAGNGQEALELAIELMPDIIVSDVMMPILDGFEFCQKVKADMRTNHIPVVILTARVDFESKMEGLEIGANAYLPKPFEEQELNFTLKNLLDLRNNQHQYYLGNENEISSPTTIEKTSVVEKASLVEDPFVISVRARIEEHLDNADLSVEQLAKELHLSHSQFGRKLNALTGLSPTKFIRATRLKKAKALLMDSSQTITEVSYACGFNDPSYFTRVFKKEFGVTPLEWRSGVE